jgi:hypothetical protein
MSRWSRSHRSAAEEPPVALPADSRGVGIVAVGGTGITPPRAEAAPAKQTFRDRIQRLGNLLVRREQQSEPFKRMTSLVERTERALIHDFNRPALSVRYTRSCGLVSDVLAYCTQQEAERTGYPMEAKQYQLQDVHAAAAGVKPGDPNYAAIHDQAFGHGFDIVSIGDEKFLGDLSFAQFLSAEIVPDISYAHRRELATNPLVKTLLTTGFFPLNKKNLSEYVRLTTSLRGADASYTDAVDPAIFESIEPIPLDFERPQLHPAIGLPDQANA